MSRTMSFMALIIISFLLTGCEDGMQNIEGQINAKMEEVVKDTIQDIGETVKESAKDALDNEMKSIQEDVEEMIMGKQYTIFYSDDQAERFLETEVEIPEDAILSQALLKELIKQGVLSDGTALNAVEVIDGSMKLDFSDEFATAVQAMGTSGEYMILGSVVNTFLEAYDANEVMITVNGNYLETGHNIYDWPQKVYSDNVAVEE